MSRIDDILAAAEQNTAIGDMVSAAHSEAEKARAEAGAPHVVTAYVRADDPMSLLLLQVLPGLQARFDIALQIKVVEDIEADMYPEPEAIKPLFAKDAAALAGLYGLDFPADFKVPDAVRTHACNRLMVSVEGEADAAAQMIVAMRALWRGEALPEAEPGEEAATAALRANEAALQEQGHYSGAMLHYGGDWYWGLDRLDHLEARLNALGLNKGAAEQRFTKTWDGYCKGPAGAGQNGPALHFYFSVRSPYSYVSVPRTLAFAEHYKVPLVLKPVLPMLMRGLKVPPTKSRYIFLDTYREAKKLGVPFGTIADPLGKPVERCYALVELARAEGVMAEWLLSFTQGVWAEGIDGGTDEGLRKMAQRAGLNWADCEPLLEDQSWRGWAEDNILEMYRAGLWGVPSYIYGDPEDPFVATWGQDRLWMVEQAICPPADQSA